MAACRWRSRDDVQNLPNGEGVMKRIANRDAGTRAHFSREWLKAKLGLIACECLTEGSVGGEAGADAVSLFDHGCARTVTGQSPCHLVPTDMASAMTVSFP
jgi:hypothetical protein